MFLGWEPCFGNGSRAGEAMAAESSEFAMVHFRYGLP